MNILKKVYGYLNKLIAKILRRLGYVLFRLPLKSESHYQLLDCLNAFDVNVVFDVGANAGQFAKGMRLVGYKGEIISFEPLTDAHAALTLAAQSDKKWTIYRQTAIGDHVGEIKINISGNSVSSSVLPMLDAHASAADTSSYIGEETVPITTLNAIAPEFREKLKKAFIKIDTQGFEWEVLDGASEMLAEVKGVLCEVSLVPLYEGQRLWMEMIERMKKEGFMLWAVQEVFCDPRDGKTLQLDVIFFRK